MGASSTNSLISEDAKVLKLLENDLGRSLLNLDKSFSNSGGYSADLEIIWMIDIMSEIPKVETKLDFIILVTYGLSIIGLLLGVFFILLFFFSNGIDYMFSPKEPIPDDLPDFKGFFVLLGFLGALICLPPSFFGLIFNFGMQKRRNFARYGISAIYLVGILVLLYLFYRIISLLWSLRASELIIPLILVRFGLMSLIFIILFCWAIYVEYILLFDFQVKKIFTNASSF